MPGLHWNYSSRTLWFLYCSNELREFQVNKKINKQFVNYDSSVTQALQINVKLLSYTRHMTSCLPENGDRSTH